MAEGEKKQYVLLISCLDKKVKRELELATLTELRQFIAKEFQIPEFFKIRYFDPEFEEEVDLEDIKNLPLKSKLLVILPPPQVVPLPFLPPVILGPPPPGFPVFNGPPPLLVPSQFGGGQASDDFTPLTPQNSFGPNYPSQADPNDIAQLVQAVAAAEEEEITTPLQHNNDSGKNSWSKLTSSDTEPTTETPSMVLTDSTTSTEPTDAIEPLTLSNSFDSLPGTTGPSTGSSSRFTMTGMHRALSESNNNSSSNITLGNRRTNTDLVRPVESFRNSEVYSERDQEKAVEITKDMIEKGVRNLLKDHKQYFKTYPKTISGEELMKFWTAKGYVNGIGECLTLGQNLMNYDLLVPVNDKTTFKPFKTNFYRFVEDVEAEADPSKGPSVATLRKKNGTICGNLLYKKSGLRFKKKYIVICPSSHYAYFYSTQYDTYPSTTVNLIESSLYIKGSGEVTTGLYSFVIKTPTFSVLLAAKKQDDQESWLSALVSSGGNLIEDGEERVNANSLYEDQFNITDIDGRLFKFSELKGKVCLIANVASKCGLTCPNYKGLQELHEKYVTKGLVILGFPCNQFGRQEPGSPQEIKEFLKNSGVTFTILSKVKVNGTNSHPIFKYLRSRTSGLLGNSIKWNFTKFLVNKEGVPVKRFSPATNPKALESHIVSLLQAPYPSEA